MAMKALFFNFTLEKSPRVSSTQAPVDRSASIFNEHDVESQMIEVTDYKVAFGVSSDKREGNEYSPGKIKSCDISVVGAPILFGDLPLSRSWRLRGKVIFSIKPFGKRFALYREDDN